MRHKRFRGIRQVADLGFGKAGKDKTMGGTKKENQA